MRPARQALGWTVLGVLVIGAFLLGRARRPADLGDRRASTFLAGPDGARGLAEGLERLDIGVERWRRRVREFILTPPAGDRFALALLDPTRGLEATEVSALAEWHGTDRGGDLILVGDATDRLMECFGWVTGDLSFSNLPVAPPGRDASSSAAAIALFLEPDLSVIRADAEDRLCDPVPIASVDTLLVASGDRIAAVRLHRADVPGSVLLLSDADLLRNRTLRETATGSVLLSFFAGRYDRVVFDEGLHGFGASGSLAGAVLQWSRRSPWGWAVWQLAIVGVLALLVGAWRFGPVRPGVERRRRSPLEHVNALATALSAAKGHDVAIAALVRGLRRRLAPGRPGAAEPGEWLRDLAARTTTPKAKQSAVTLLALSAPGQPATAVLGAAHAVEDLWEEMHR